MATGKEIAPPELWMPPNGKPYGLNLFNGVINMTTAQGCGGNPNAFLRLRSRDEEGRSVHAGSGGMWPRSGLSIGKDGTVDGEQVTVI